VTAAQRGDGEPTASSGPLARALADAVVLGDSKGDADQAAKILAGAVRRHGDGAPATELLEALTYLLELGVRRRDPGAARDVLARIDALDPAGVEAPAVAELRAAAEDLDAADQHL
jgi:hypothetical protein